MPVQHSGMSTCSLKRPSQKRINSWMLPQGNCCSSTVKSHLLEFVAVNNNIVLVPSFHKSCERKRSYCVWPSQPNTPLTQTEESDKPAQTAAPSCPLCAAHTVWRSVHWQIWTANVSNEMIHGGNFPNAADSKFQSVKKDQGEEAAMPHSGSHWALIRAMQRSAPAPFGPVLWPTWYHGFFRRPRLISSHSWRDTAQEKMQPCKFALLSLFDMFVLPVERQAKSQ